MLGKFVAVPFACLAILLTLAACQGQAAPNDQRFGNPPSPTGAPTDLPTTTPTSLPPNTPTSVPTDTPATAPTDTPAAAPTTVTGPTVTTSSASATTPTLQGTAARPTAQAQPASGTPVAQNAQIEIITASPHHTTIKPGETALVTPINNSITVLVHYPAPLGSEVNGSFHPYPVTITVNPPNWQAGVHNPPNAQTLDFELTGSAPGSHTVTITIPQLGPPIQFTLVIAGANLTPTGTPSGTRTITITDNGKTITLQPGQRFLLSLPQGYNWQVSIGDPSVVSYATGFMAPAGTQGLFEAKQAGHTSFSAVGDPPCRSANPPCALPSRLFQVTIVVQ